MIFVILNSFVCVIDDKASLSSCNSVNQNSIKTKINIGKMKPDNDFFVVVISLSV